MSRKKPSIPIPDQEVKDMKLKFSFEYYDCSREYCISNWDKEQIFKSLSSLKDINTKNHNELANGKTYHFHAVNWTQTIKKSFPDKGLNNSAFQFALTTVPSKEGARVFGSLYRNIFYIIWFDLHHEIWPAPLKYT